MPDASELVSLTNLKAFLSISSSGKDTILQAIKDGVEAAVMRYCDRDLLVPSTPYTEYYEGDGSHQLIVDQRPVISVTSVYIDPSRLFPAATLVPDLNTGSPSELVSTASQLRAGIIELFNYAFLKGRGSVKITYSAGYSVVPADLQLAVKLICSKEYKVQDLGMSGQVSQQVGDKTVTFAVDTWPKNAVEILDRYRRMVV